jgi:hypothetical protein
MKTQIITSNDFLSGNFFKKKDIERHTLKAKWENGKIIVTDQEDNKVEVTYGATIDMRTCTAYVNGLGFIGGWQYPHKKMPFSELVNKINQGILYPDMNNLPTGRKKK